MGGRVENRASHDAHRWPEAGAGSVRHLPTGPCFCWTSGPQGMGIGRTTSQTRSPERGVCLCGPVLLSSVLGSSLITARWCVGRPRGIAMIDRFTWLGGSVPASLMAFHGYAAVRAMIIWSPLFFSLCSHEHPSKPCFSKTLGGGCAAARHIVRERQGRPLPGYFDASMLDAAGTVGRWRPNERDDHGRSPARRERGSGSRHLGLYCL
ncbi:hypothetical protein GQ53DRAFT_749253 [Thozetella sp. PMI_491]|nr:hypothetical protein GQ53DRAFT_749253 [Thozetella sp. PMI_491]